VPRLRDVPLFPLGIVLLPGEVLPLHIFEPRYRELVARCLAGPEPFCIVHADDEGIREVGCLAVGLEVVERFDDGRLSIVVTGGEPLQIQRVDEEAHAYLAADGVTVDDDEELASDEAVEQALDAYRELVDVAEGGEGPPEPEVGPRLSYEIAGRIDFGPEVKQRLLEDRSEPKRLNEVVELVVRATRAVRTASAVSARARTNGRVSPPEEVEGDDSPPHEDDGSE
jgi:Lon protease-like protein